MLYTIVWSNSDGHGKLVSWLGATFNSEAEALDFAAKVAHELWDTMPSLSYMVMMHRFEWRENDA